MKKSLTLVGILSIGYTYAQEERIGINIENPSATLSVKTRVDSKSPKSLELENEAGTKLLTVLNNGNVGIGKEDPTSILYVQSQQNRSHVRIASFMAPNLEAGNSNHINLGRTLNRFNSGSLDFLWRGEGSNLNGIGLNIFGIGGGDSFILFAQANRRVGINNNSPSEALDISGNMYIKNPNVEASTMLRIGANNDRFAYVRYEKNGKTRWDAGIGNETEGGNNEGSDYYVHAFDDEGNFLARRMVIKRATGNLGIGVSNPSQKLEVGGNIRSTTLTGTGDRPVYADANGVLKVGDASVSKVATNSTAKCDEETRGTMNFGRISINGKETDAIGFCMKNSNNEFKWYYIYGGAAHTVGDNPTFGAGL